MQTFQQQIKDVIVPKVQKELGIKNPMAVPRFQKVVVNVGIGSRFTRNKDYSDVVENITAITGQKPSVRFSKKSISNFKLRENTPNGVVVTLRGRRMYDFLNRLINVAFPRIRDFQGMSDKGFDRRGNYSLGLKDISVFTAVKDDDLSNLHGVEITIVTSALTDEMARALLKACNFPFKKPIAKKTEESVVSVSVVDAVSE